MIHKYKVRRSLHFVAHSPHKRSMHRHRRIRGGSLMHTVGEHVGSFLRTESAKSMAHSIADKGMDMVADAIAPAATQSSTKSSKRKERRDTDDNLHVGSSSLTEHQRALLRKMINKH